MNAGNPETHNLKWSPPKPFPSEKQSKRGKECGGEEERKESVCVFKK